MSCAYIPTEDDNNNFVKDLNEFLVENKDETQ